MSFGRPNQKRRGKPLSRYVMPRPNWPIDEIHGALIFRAGIGSQRPSGRLRGRVVGLCGIAPGTREGRSRSRATARIRALQEASRSRATMRA